jgi:hypothetical protein
MSGTGADAPITSSIPRALLVASTISWLLGILAFGSGLTVGIPFDSVPGGAVTLAALAICIGSAFCYGGYGLRKKRRSAGSAALGAAIAVIGLRLLTTGSIGPIELTAIALMVLVATNWKYLATRRRGSSANQRLQAAVASLQPAVNSLLGRARLRLGRAVAAADAQVVRQARTNPESSPMNQRQLASVLFAAVGLFIVLLHLNEFFMLVTGLSFSTLGVEGFRMPAVERMGLAISLVGVVLPVLGGLILILFRGRVANLLFPPAIEPVSSPDIQAVALSVLGCYFAVDGASKLVQSGRPNWSSVTLIVLGIALFFGARGLARLWSLSRSTGHQADVTKTPV